MKLQLTDEQKKAVAQHHGFVEVDGSEDSYVVLSRQVFREMMGVGSDDEYLASLKAIEEGLSDVAAGRTRSMQDFFSEFDRRHGISD